MSIVYCAFADEFGESLKDQLTGLSITSIYNLEIRFVDGVNIAYLDDEAILRIKRAFTENRSESCHISVFAIGSPIGKISIDDDFEEHIKLFERVCWSANMLGAKNIRIFSFYNKNNINENDYRQQVYEKIERLLDIADQYHVTLCHENEAGIYGESPRRCRELLDHFKGRLKCVFDGGNFVLGGYDPVEAYSLLCNYIEYFHIKDATKDGEITVPGYGDAKIKEIVKDFDSKHVYTHITVEPHLTDFIGLNSLACSNIKRMFNFKTTQDAFMFAVYSLRQELDDNVTTDTEKRILRMLHWSSPAKAKREALRLITEQQDLSFLVMPDYYFQSWDSCADVFFFLGDEEIAPVLPKLPEWLYDFTIPGAEKIERRLLEIMDKRYLGEALSRIVTDHDKNDNMLLIDNLYRFWGTSDVLRSLSKDAFYTLIELNIISYDERFNVYSLSPDYFKKHNYN